MFRSILFTRYHQWNLPLAILIGLIYFLCMTADGFRGGLGWYVMVNIFVSAIAGLIISNSMQFLVPLVINKRLRFNLLVISLLGVAVLLFGWAREYYLGFGWLYVVLEYAIYASGWLVVIAFVILISFAFYSVGLSWWRRIDLIVLIPITIYIVSILAFGVIKGVDYWHSRVIF